MKLIIGLTGTLASGKGTVAELIMRHSFDHVILSSIIKEEAVNRNIEFTRENLQKLGNELREKNGSQVLAEMAFRRFEHSSKPLVIDGIRNIGEVDFLKNIHNIHNDISNKKIDCRFYLISVDAPLDVRYNRTLKRKSSKDMISLDEFKRLDAKDKGLNEKSTGQRVQDCLDRADFIIMNDSDFEGLKEKVDDILKKI